jgi:tetratricopeptide (TPR) repeat protein
MKAKQFDAAIDAFGELLEALEVSFGGQHIETAPVLFEYGSALLLKAETAADLFGDAMKGEGAPSNSEEDLEIAWEVLEVAKNTLLQHSTKDARLLLARVYLRLADLCLDQGNCEQAILDYRACLVERQTFLKENDRLLADVYTCLAIAYLYNSARHQDPAGQRQQAIEQYLLASRVIESLLKQVADKTGSPVALSALPTFKETAVQASQELVVTSKRRKKGSHSARPSQQTMVTRIEATGTVDWNIAIKKGWHPACAVPDSSRLPNKKRIRSNRAHPAAFLTKAEGDVAELVSVLSELKEKIADTVKLNNDAKKEKEEKMAAAFKSVSSSGAAAVAKQPESIVGEEQNVYANSGFDKSVFGNANPIEGVTTIGFGNSASTTPSSNAMTPDTKGGITTIGFAPPANTQGGVTTIGFGNSASGNTEVSAPEVGPDGSITTIGFGAPTMTSSNMPPANLLVAKKKRKVVNSSQSDGAQVLQVKRAKLVNAPSAQ